MKRTKIEVEMRHKSKSNRFKKRRLNDCDFQQKKIAEAHERRANDPVKQAKIDAQAYELIRERIAMFGDKWREGCAIRIPSTMDIPSDAK